MVEEALNGRGDQFKKRTVGIEVFRRQAGYDTASDPIVRVSASEIRKRIAQYYAEPARHEELRISLPAGSYVPHFDWPAAEPAPQPTAQPTPGPSALSPDWPIPPAVPAPPSPQAAPAIPPSSPRSVWRWLAPVLLLVLLAAGTFWHSVMSKSSALDQFWAPVMASTDHPAVICFSHAQLETVALRDASQPELLHSFPEQTRALFLDDVEPLVSIAPPFGVMHRQYSLVDDTTSLTDLRHGPTVFLGAFDNAWTLRITHDLRFRFGNDPAMRRFWIEDTRAPHQRWEIDRGVQVATNNYRDYALVARFVDASTGQLAIVSAGIPRGGTVAAGEFLTQPGIMNSLRTRAAPGWQGQNMEFVSAPR